MVVLNRNIELTREKAMFFSIFFCPSFVYFFVFILSFTVGVITITQFFPDSEEAAMREFLLEIPAYIVVCLCIFYILQNRELKNFYQEHKAIASKEQITKVFNS